MSVSIEAIYEKTKEKYKMQLKAGNKGIGHVISWIYIMEDITTIDFIRGSELIITTGLGIKSEADFCHMIQVLINKNASGMIVNIGNYIKTIPQSVIDLCNQAAFPLFVMPWEIHLVDISQEYCNWFIRDKQKQFNLSECFYNILFQPDKADISLIKNFGYDRNGLYNIAVMGIAKELAEMDKDEINGMVEIEILSKIQKAVQKVCSIVYENKIIVIMQLGKAGQDAIADILEAAIKENKKLLDTGLGIGSVSESIESLVKSYKHALAAYDLSVNRNKETVFYEKMGIYKILSEVEDKQVLDNIYLEYIGKIEEYDKFHHSKYLDTLRLYLEFNSSIQAVAEKSFAHRNTINYRIKKIKELLICDLDDNYVRFMLQLCFYIKDMQNVSENKK